ncbi:hypothetical protein IMG5_063560 [Ichthyophthirius multifiliis]|uniref:Uncharacterized protein n=1 Tax=Ichthyophthirius multifiliis TaxID=5932 RepID=G0QP28_ICHMU|nr:hypothetical protein IMG5_063560 [Ichthyophthirius multifiliis]EGR33015.1 hypothetical protein IMG5_063560 [Ichthyophthirius multifiliis]|eukprot:XP_004037001.1 hypothetical protein IMG5_063560 [Ichthyophthirius multifiliis]
MVNINQIISDEWKVPKEGFSEDLENDSDFEIIRFGINQIDKIIEFGGKDICLQILISLVEKMLSFSQDWRYKFAAIMGLSQIGEYVENIGKIKPIIQTVLEFLKSENPMISYVLSGWQRICLKYSSEIQSYLPDIVPGVFRIIQDEKNYCDLQKTDFEECEIALGLLEDFSLQMSTWVSELCERQWY